MSIILALLFFSKIVFEFPAIREKLFFAGVRVDVMIEFTICHYAKNLEMARGTIEGVDEHCTESGRGEHMRTTTTTSTIASMSWLVDYFLRLAIISCV